MNQLHFFVLLVFIKKAFTEFSLYQISSDYPTNSLLPNQTITLSCLVDLSRGGQVDIVWYRRLGKIWQIIGKGDYLNNFFQTSRYIVTRESMTRLQIVYSLVIKDLKIEDSGSIYCSGYKHLPESLTPFIINICDNPKSSYCKCLSNDMSSHCALDILSKETDYNAMQRACIAIAVCLAVTLFISILLTVLVLRRDCKRSPTPNAESNSNIPYESQARLNSGMNTGTIPQSIMKTNRALTSDSYQSSGDCNQLKRTNESIQKVNYDLNQIPINTNPTFQINNKGQSKYLAQSLNRSNFGESQENNFVEFENLSFITENSTVV